MPKITLEEWKQRKNTLPKEEVKEPDPVAISQSIHIFTPVKPLDHIEIKTKILDDLSTRAPDQTLKIEEKEEVEKEDISLEEFRQTKRNNLETSFISCRSEEKNNSDHTRLRHNRHRNEGFKIGYYNQTPPILFTRDGHNVFMGDMYRGACAFLILGGPSMNQIDLSILKQPGILTMGINNSVRSFRPNLWLSVDNPQSFIMSTWIDPTITKFVPYAHADKRLFDNNTWEMSNIHVGDCPNVFYYRRNEHFQANQFLLEDTMNWGNHSNLCVCGYWRPDQKKTKQKVDICPRCNEKAFGSRSVFLPAMRMLYFLGVRTIFLVGCDFKMEVGKSNYAFAQDRAGGSVSGNNSSYTMLKGRFEELKSIFEKLGLSVFNCNPESALETFPKVSFEDAVASSIEGFPDVLNERTEGLYERKKT